jgi:hypothetical protein
MNEDVPKSPESAQRYKYEIGDYVSTTAQNLTYYGQIIDRRPYKHGGKEYLVDLKTYAQGETWVVEFRLSQSSQSEAANSRA